MEWFGLSRGDEKISDGFGGYIDSGCDYITCNCGAGSKNFCTSTDFQSSQICGVESF